MPLYAVAPDTIKHAYEKFQYSPAVRSGDLLFVSGQVGRDASMEVPGDLRQEFVMVFENLTQILAAEGLTPEHIISINSFHTNAAEMALFGEVKNEYLTGEIWPAWTAITIQELALPEAHVEMSVIARYPSTSQ